MYHAAIAAINEYYVINIAYTRVQCNNEYYVMNSTYIKDAMFI